MDSNSGASIAPSPGRVAAAAVLEDERHVIAGDRRGAIRRIRRGLARDRQCAPADILHFRDDERPVELHPAPIDPAKVRQHLEHRIALGQIRIGAIRAPHGPRAGGFAQHVESGGVIDLSVDQDDGAERAVAQCAVRLQIGESLQLRPDVR